jgi:hypothetical protein
MKPTPACSYAESRELLWNIRKEQKFDFVYYTFSEVLVGALGGTNFNMRAVSGGGRGGKAPESTLASYSSHRSTVKQKGSYLRRGGSLPPGLWRIEKPSLYTGKLGRPVAKLTPLGMQRTEFPTRDYDAEPFLIHGPGTLGSDGCIVIERTHRAMLLNAIEKAGGAILLVSNMVQPGDLLDHTQRATYTA